MHEMGATEMGNGEEVVEQNRLGVMGKGINMVRGCFILLPPFSSAPFLI